MEGCTQPLNHSWGRFIGITLLMAVSAFAFIGLKMAGPDMRNTAQTYYQEVNLADLTVSSNYGLDKNDTQTIKKQAKKAILDFGYLRDTTINNSRTSLRVLSESKNISTSQLIIVLQAKTSELLLPKAPKNGSRILLEKIKPF